MASRRLLIASLYLTLAVAITASVFAIWPVVADAPWEDSAPVVVPVQPTPVGRPTRTALEVSQAVRTQLPDWCTSPFDETITSAPRWEESSKVWILGCSILPRIGGPFDQARVSCYEIDDRTLEITLGRRGISLLGPWDC